MREDELTSASLEVENTVLLEDRAQHGLDDDAGAGVGDEGGLFMQLLGEEVDTQVSVLAGGRRGGDADDLARAALENQEVSNADVVGGDGDSVGRAARNGAARCNLRASTTNGDVNLLPVVVVMGTTDDAFGSAVEPVAERVVVT